MGKLKSPLLSLGAKGTIANSLTFQERNQGTIVREKPIPAYRKTLPQQYQRWLYEDYAYLWTQQTETTKRQYAASSVRHHLTGFQYWMKYHLKNMPDIVAWYRLDEKAGAIAYDSSPGEKHGVIYGASPADGLIAGSQSFDGLNDCIKADPPPIYSGTALTILFFLNTPAFDGSYKTPLWHGWDNSPYGFMFLRYWNQNKLAGYLRNTAGVRVEAYVSYTPDTWEQRGLVWDGTTLYQIRNADLSDPLPFTGTITLTAPLFIGRQEAPGIPRWFPGYLDNLIIFNRTLDQPSIARWAERRYPA